MDFPHFDFNSLNETDIREEIIAPLLRYLGYRSGTANNIIREQHLTYPKSSLGRKDKNDPNKNSNSNQSHRIFGREQISGTI
jgi:hypothetical protein